MCSSRPSFGDTATADLYVGVDYDFIVHGFVVIHDYIASTRDQCTLCV